MALPVTYAAGTVSVTSGETTVTGVNTLWGEDAIMPGDLFCDPAQPLVPPQRVASVTDDGELELWAPWPGDTMSEDAYEIRYVGIIERSTAQSRRVLEELRTVKANGRGMFYRFSDTTTDGDPGSGYLRLDTADPSLTAEIYIDNLDANGGAVSAVIDTWDDSSSLDKGTLWLRSIADPSAFRAYLVTGTVVDGTGYRKLTVEHVGGSGSFADDDEIMVAFAEKGDAGDSFTYDELVADPSELAALEGEDTGYLVFVTDLETEFGAYAGRSGVVRLIAGPDWELVALYSGPKGDKGDTGDKGWSPQMVIVSDGARRVWQLDGYIGGEGDAPTANVGQYLKSDGTWTSTIGDAADVRGPSGLNGAGTVASVEAGEGIAVDDTDPTAPVLSVVEFTGDSGSGGALGGVPAPAAGDAAANRFLKADGTWGKTINLGTPVASTSGVNIDFTGIPAWAKRITVHFASVSLSESAGLVLQIGDSGGVESSGYTGVNVQATASGISGTGLSSSFVLTTGSDAAAARVGSVVLELMDGSLNRWSCRGLIGNTSDVRTNQVAGYKSLDGSLDRVRIASSNGTDTFDSGQINISYE